MKIAVLGSGVIGVTSAHALNALGHEVTVYDRQPGPALETSFANAGQVSWGYASPWAAPGIPLKAAKWMFTPDAPLLVRPRVDPQLWAWLARMLANCTAARYAVNKERMLRLALYSRDSLKALRAAAGLHYDEGTLGTLQLFRDQKGIDAVAADMAVLTRFQVPHRLLDRAGCIAVEPALANVADKIAGGLHLPGDETGDCFKFTNGLAALAQQNGVTFRYGTEIAAIEAEGDRIARVRIQNGTIEADAYLLALSSHTPTLTRGLDIRVPVYPVKGYSATLPVVEPDRAPRSTILDEASKVAVTRLGDRIRAAGTAELTGYDLTLTKTRCAMIQRVVDDLFPGGGDRARVQYWTGLRPMTPDGTPIVGPTRYRNLYLNTGHGTLGWTMACGSARVVADLMSGRKPEIAADDLSEARYR